MTDSTDLVVTETIAAPAAVVFGYFTDPERYAQWMGADVTLEPEPGGTYAVTIRDGIVARGRFVEVEPPTRVVFTWGWEEHPLVPPGSSTVEVVLDESDGVTTVTLTHRGLPTAEERDNHGDGWQLYLARLGVAATGGDPGPDPNATPPEE